MILKLHVASIVLVLDDRFATVHLRRTTPTNAVVVFEDRREARRALREMGAAHYLEIDLVNQEETMCRL